MTIETKHNPSDQELADRLRSYQAAVLEAAKELESRGYRVYTQTVGDLYTLRDRELYYPCSEYSIVISKSVTSTVNI